MTIPHEVQQIIATLQKAGFEAYAVGGCVRDLLLNKTPNDWDITTNAKPNEIQKLFPRSFYTNQFGTVTILTSPPPYKGGDKGVVAEVEVTTYRVDVDYSDQRHPDEIKFTNSLREDLARRDFTINAMALSPNTDSPPFKGGDKGVVIDGQLIIDPFGGIKDLHNKTIRAVGNPSDRFAEDALRLLRAVRLAAQLEFTIDGNPPNKGGEGGFRHPPSDKPNTFAAIIDHAADIKVVSQERVRDELIKIVMSHQPEYGFNLLQTTGLLAIILPELAEGIGVDQNKHHTFTVYEHSIKSLQYAANFGYSLPIRLAALFHDIGKPRTKHAKAEDYTFYAHDIVGARMTATLMKRLKFPNETTDQVVHLIRHHMFYYDIGKVTETGARRLLRRVGKENFKDLIKLRIAERKGSGVPKAEPYRLRHLQFLVEKAAQQPVSVRQLAIGGNDLIKELNLKPSPIIGGILNALLAEVLDDPAKNTRDHLLKQAAKLKEKNPQELKKLGEAAKEEEMLKKEDDIRRKYRV